MNRILPLLISFSFITYGAFALGYTYDPVERMKEEISATLYQQGCNLKSGSCFVQTFWCDQWGVPLMYKRPTPSFPKNCVLVQASDRQIRHFGKILGISPVKNNYRIQKNRIWVTFVDNEAGG